MLVEYWSNSKGDLLRRSRDSGSGQQQKSAGEKTKRSHRHGFFAVDRGLGAGTDTGVGATSEAAWSAAFALKAPPLNEARREPTPPLRVPLPQRGRRTMMALIQFLLSPLGEGDRGAVEGATLPR